MITAICSCNGKKSDNTVTKTDTTMINHTDSVATTTTDTRYFWTSDWDNKKGLTMKKTDPISPDSMTAGDFIKKLNDIYPEIILRLSEIRKDSIFVTINNSRYLTQRIGSSGAQAYLAEVTYNLTELENINFVDIRFKEGDHASPGTYTRLDFVPVKN